MKITVVGLGYVGLSWAMLLSQNNKVLAFLLLQGAIKKMYQYYSPISQKPKR